MEGRLSRRMEFFGELITCGQSLYIWEFDPEMELIRTTCENQEYLQNFFHLSGCQDYLMQYVSHSNLQPLVLSDALGMSWIAGFEQLNGVLVRIYLLGPSFTSDIPIEKISQRLRLAGIPQNLATVFQERIYAMPIVSHDSWLRLGLMLHYTITGEKISISDFEYQKGEDEDGEESGQKTASATPKGGTYLAEEAALRMIEQGNLDYQKTFDRLSAASHLTLPAGSSAASREMKNAVNSFLTLATRAAIRGGMNPETAYFLGGIYIRQVEQANTFTELMRINSAAYDDFVHRVHKLHQGNGPSPTIRQCCDYIELHLTEELSPGLLAEKVGYSPNYLMQKFKKEVGCTITQFIHQKKVEQAKRMLRSDSQDIQAISDALQFCNPSYFAEVFRSITGMTPAEYRQG